jgi:Protein of unknown function (DUF938)
MSDDRQYAPATVRNRDFILDVLRDVLPKTGVILEIASGSGEHIVHFAKNLPSLVFQPSDPDADARLSVAAWGGNHCLCIECAHHRIVDCWTANHIRGRRRAPWKEISQIGTWCSRDVSSLSAALDQADVEFIIEANGNGLGTRRRKRLG